MKLKRKEQAKKIKISFMQKKGKKNIKVTTIIGKKLKLKLKK